MLADTPQAERKQMLFTRLYPVVHKVQPHAARKITGILLEMDNSELLRLAMEENELQLRQKVDEVMRTLNPGSQISNHRQQQTQSAQGGRAHNQSPSQLVQQLKCDMLAHS